MSKTVLFQTIQFSISMQLKYQNSSILSNLVLHKYTVWFYSTHSGPGSDDNEGVVHIPQSSIITGTSPSDCLASYPGHSLGGGGALPLCIDAVGVFYSPSQLGMICILI